MVFPIIIPERPLEQYCQFTIQQSIELWIRVDRGVRTLSVSRVWVPFSYVFGDHERADAPQA